MMGYHDQPSHEFSQPCGPMVFGDVSEETCSGKADRRVTAVCQVIVNRATVATGSVVDGGDGFWIYCRNWYSDL